MRQYIYVSNAAPDFCEDDLGSILSTSRQRNGDDGITGFLLFNGRNFLQLVEGESGVLDPLIRRLHDDDRHSGIRAVEDREVAARCCEDWAMHLIQIGGAVSDKRRILDEALPVGLVPPQRDLVLNFARLT